MLKIGVQKYYFFSYWPNFICNDLMHSVHVSV